MSLKIIGLLLALLSCLTIPATLLMPHIKIYEHEYSKEPKDEGAGKVLLSKLENESKVEIAPLGKVFDIDPLGKEKTNDANLFYFTVTRVLLCRCASSIRDIIYMYVYILCVAEEDNKDTPVYNKLTEGTKEVPLLKSLCTISAFLHTYWQFINFFLVLFYSASFNSWLYKITDDQAESTFTYKE